MLKPNLIFILIEKNTKPLKESSMFAEVLNEFNYMKKQRKIKKINAEITQNSNVDRSLEIQAEEASFNTTYTNTFNVNPASNSYKKRSSRYI